MKKPKNQLKNIENRRVRFDYELGEELVAGISLSGAQVRAVRDGRVSLKGSFIALKPGKRGFELWLNNASFSLKNQGEGALKTDTVDTSPKKLLAHRSQIEKLATQKQSGYTIVPIKIIAGGRYIKVVIASAKGKKLHDKRESLKQKQAKRESDRMLKRF